MPSRIATVLAAAGMLVALSGCQPTGPITVSMSQEPSASPSVSMSPEAVATPEPSASSSESSVPTAPKAAAPVTAPKAAAQMEPPAPAAPMAPAAPPAAAGPAGPITGAGAPGAPRVFMAPHGANQLAADSGLDSQWTFVRENLDGIWGNATGLSRDEQIQLFKKVTTRNVITEVGLGEPGTVNVAGDWGATGDYGWLEEGIGSKINRQGIAFYTDDPARWSGRSIAEAKQKYITNPKNPLERYDAVYTGWNTQNFGPNKPAMTPESNAAISQADGMFVECNNDHCAPGTGLGDELRKAIKINRDANKPFIWFTAPADAADSGSGFLKNFQESYNALRAEGLWRENDVVMIINYEGKYPAVPETVNGQPADTITGTLKWALEQNW
ncbi:MAG: hypothetical protein ACRCYX_06130 [Dermatophilaceae bacterium]